MNRLFDEDLLVAYNTIIEAIHLRLRTSVQACCPNAKFSTYDQRTEDSVTWIATVLHSASGDNVDLELELVMREEVFWCTATLYISQRTFMDLQSKWWKTGVPSGNELSAIILDFCEILIPRFLEAVDVVRLQEEDATTNQSQALNMDNI